MSAPPPILEIDRVSMSFGGLTALSEVSFDVREGEILSLIGPNGAGKTTLLNIVAGALAPTSGRVRFRGTPVDGRPPHEINRLGIGRTFQSAEIFGRLTVRENVAAGGVAASDIGLVSCFSRWGRARRVGDALARAADEALAFVGLADLGDRPAAGLPAGQQRLLALARTMATGAELLLLDEPGAGLNEREKAALIDLIRRLAGTGRTVVLVEHDMSVVGRLSDRIVVLEQGRVIADGEPDSVRRDPRVIEAYLGGAVDISSGSPKPASEAADGRPQLLSIRGLDVRYDGVTALDRVSLAVNRGEIVAIVGANGAGKSTLLKTVAGVVEPSRGEIDFEGESIVGASPDAIVRRGVSLTPEGRQLFPSLSVADNLALGRYAPLKASGGFLRLLRFGPAQRDDLRRHLGAVHALFPVLRERRDQPAGTLSGGQGQMLAIGRGLMSGPTLLMLDEPSLGLAPLIVEEIMRTLLRLRDEGLTVLLVEQNANAALQIADRAYVLAGGRVVAEGRATDLLADQDIAAAYLGGGAEAGGRGASPQDGTSRRVKEEAAE